MSKRSMFPKAGFCFVSTNMFSKFMRGENTLTISHKMVENDDKVCFYNGDLLFLNHIHSAFSQYFEMFDFGLDKSKAEHNLKHHKRCALLTKLFLTSENENWWDMDNLLELITVTKDLLDTEGVIDIFLEIQKDALHKGLEKITEKTESGEFNEGDYLQVANELKYYSFYQDKAYIEAMRDKFEYISNTLPRISETEEVIHYNLQEVKSGTGRKIDLEENEKPQPFVFLQIPNTP